MTRKICKNFNNPDDKNHSIHYQPYPKCMPEMYSDCSIELGAHCTVFDDSATNPDPRFQQGIRFTFNFGNHPSEIPLSQWIGRIGKITMKFNATMFS
jgi:hypothetical protein